MEAFDYGEVCPVSKAASVLCERWTLQIVREMLMGATRFTEFQRYLPKISPALLNTRLKNLEEQGVIFRRRISGKSGYEYYLTPAGKDLQPLLIEFGKWGMQWAFDSVEEGEMNPSVITRDFAKALDVEQFPAADGVIQFNITDEYNPAKKFVLVRDGHAQSCDENIGHEVDIYLNAELKVFYQIWFGETSLTKAIKEGKLKPVGPTHFTQHISRWLRNSQFAPYNKAATKSHEAEMV